MRGRKDAARGKQKGRLYLGSVFSFFSSLATAIPMMAAAYALDTVIRAYWAGSSIESSLIWQLLWVIMGSIALNFLLSYLRAVLQESIGYEVAAGQRIHLGDVLKRVPLGYFSQNSVGDILTAVCADQNIHRSFSRLFESCLNFFFRSKPRQQLNANGIVPHTAYKCFIVLLCQDGGGS